MCAGHRRRWQLPHGLALIAEGVWLQGLADRKGFQLVGRFKLFPQTDGLNLVLRVRKVLRVLFLEVVTHQLCQYFELLSAWSFNWLGSHDLLIRLLLHYFVHYFASSELQSPVDLVDIITLAHLLHFLHGDPFCTVIKL